MPNLQNSVPPRLESWRLEVDDAGELLLIGEVDGEPVAGQISTLDRDRRLAGLKDHRFFLLGAPDPALGDADPFAPPDVKQRRLAHLRTALRRIKAGDLPSDAELTNAPRLEAWTVAVDGPLPVLVGIVHGHPRIADGHVMRSSPLMWISDDRRVARTVSRWYRLGRPLLPPADELPS